MLQISPRPITKFINYNWMPDIANWGMDLSAEFYASAGIRKRSVAPALQNTRDIREGDIVFVKTDFLHNGFFQDNVLPHIHVPFILISGISSYEVPNSQIILSNKHLVRWFSTNPQSHLRGPIDSLPIGFEEDDRLPGGDQRILHKIWTTPNKRKIDKVWVPYHTIENNYARKKMLDELQTFPNVVIQREKQTFEEYLNTMQEYKYCMCLPGSGLDTHRVYESLLCRTFPIVYRSPSLMFTNRHHNALIHIEDWEELRDLKLDRKWTELTDGLVGQFLDVSFHIDRIKGAYTEKKSRDAALTQWMNLHEELGN